jgi:hypothetical protein
MHRLVAALGFTGVIVFASPALAQQTPPRPPAESVAPDGHDHGPNARMAVRNVAMLQEEFKHRNNRYASSLSELRYTVPQGVTVTFANPSPNGFSFVARFDGSECAYFRGDAQSPRPYATRASTVMCQAVPPGTGSD